MEFRGQLDALHLMLRLHKRLGDRAGQLGNMTDVRVEALILFAEYLQQHVGQLTAC